MGILGGSCFEFIHIANFWTRMTSAAPTVRLNAGHIEFFGLSLKEETSHQNLWYSDAYHIGNHCTTCSSPECLEQKVEHGDVEERADGDRGHHVPRRRLWRETRCYIDNVSIEKNNFKSSHNLPCGSVTLSRQGIHTTSLAILVKVGSYLRTKLWRLSRRGSRAAWSWRRLGWGW